MPAQIFKNHIIAAAGPLPGQLTVDNLKRWTELRKGKFIEDLDDDITHLLCTKEQFDKKLPRVKQALKLGKCIHIVHCDWFEYSTVKNKKLPEADYSMRSLVAKANAKKREKARIERGKKNAEKFVDTNLFHLYRDRHNFIYQVEITRDNSFTDEYGQKYYLCLWESNAKPHLYWFTAKFLKHKGSSQPSYHRPSPHQGKWRAEMELFMAFFKKKTGIDWQDRVSLAQTMPSSYFQYEPPSNGKPVGRRLKHDVEYCREINAKLRGLPWPPADKEEDKTKSAEDESNAGPRPIKEDDQVMTSPPSPPRAPEHGDKAEEKGPGDDTEMISFPDSEQLPDENEFCPSSGVSQKEKKRTSRSETGPLQDEKPAVTGLEVLEIEKKVKSPPGFEHAPEADKMSHESMETEPQSALATPAPSVDEKDLSGPARSVLSMDAGGVDEIGISLEFEAREPL
ncbi:hypothetical protein FBEOM_13665 [Fusarium beomiforme]|uniref:BRCT domain-containing protein n=1 Tax=Fusarium beomiforme TaxID=44412 RepID=A0A9P5DRW1_9HYPO|nr:hypothetical protein FBEOM_13665 [Fusarium beomiforme]